ncbi:phage tail protein [Rouxiella chamberiensis]|uniref:Phage tail protein n=1 Tax=Rouxiella chamberiensis TaxID=1513468 RepID=A0ABY7HNU7_9GAMM|nr:phage tail protein [Rouxiella chamberiensis]WAT01034.1 phage tail protein [Rouxiella chamberiensis]
MLKPKQLREALTQASPYLQRNPDSFNMFIDRGRVVSTLAPSLSFEYQYQVNIVITDYSADVDLLVVPILAWLRVNQPDIMATTEKRQTGYTFKVDVISDSTVDISIDLQLTERVIVKDIDGALHVEHVPEPQEPENIPRPRQLYVHGELVSEWRE